MTATDNKRIVQQGFDGWPRTAGFFHLLAEDVTWTISGSGPMSGTYTGKSDFLDRAIKPLSQRLADPILPTVETIVAEGDTVVVMWSGRATAKDGRPYNNHYCWILRLEGGMVKEATAFFDNLLLAAIW